jgi:CheY-like chemotaxis protein
MKVIGEESRLIQVLLVEDSPGDVRLTQEAFRDVDMSVILHVVSDGVAAMAFLRQEGPISALIDRILSCWILTFPKWMAERFWLRSKWMTA